MKRRNRFNSSFLGVIIGRLKFPYITIIVIGFFIWVAFMVYWETQNQYPISVTILDIEAFKLEKQTESNLFLLVYTAFFMVFNRISKRANNGENTKIKRNSIYEILPISDKDFLFGSFIFRLVVLFVILGIPYLIMVLCNPIHPAMVGVRGLYITIIILISAIYTLLYASVFNKKISKSTKIISYVFIWIFFGSYVVSTLKSSYGIVQCLSKVKVALYSSNIFNFLGSTYVVIALGVITIACFYYFNYIYILKVVKEHGWKVER